MNVDADIDRDRLFKELLTTFFVDFVSLFLPEVSALLDADNNKSSAGRSEASQAAMPAPAADAQT